MALWAKLSVIDNFRIVGILDWGPCSSQSSFRNLVFFKYKKKKLGYGASLLAFGQNILELTHHSFLPYLPLGFPVLYFKR